MESTFFLTDRWSSLFWPRTYAPVIYKPPFEFFRNWDVTSALLMTVSLLSSLGSSRALIWRGGYSVSPGLPPSPVFTWFFFVFTSTFIFHITPVFLLGAASIACIFLSAFHSGVIFGVFPASVDREPCSWGLGFMEPIPTTVVCEGCPLVIFNGNL